MRDDDTDPGFWQRQARLNGFAARVTTLGGRFPAAYAGVALEPEHDRVVVYRVPSAAFDAALHADLPGAPLRVVDAAHPAEELNRLVTRIGAELPYWQERGVAVHVISPRTDGACVEVGVADPDRARPLFAERYGAAPVRVVAADPVVPL
jgi:hypothetical protein